MHRRVSKHILSHSKRTFAETENFVQGLSTREQRNFTVAVSVRSEASDDKKSRRRLSKDERRSLVESFVNKYRAINSGNFPTANTVQKEVGGGFYFIRGIISELQHNSRMPSTNTRNNTSRDAKLHKNAGVNLEKIVEIKNSKLASKERDRPYGPTSAKDAKTLSDAITTRTSGAAVKVEKVELAAQQADKSTSALDYKAFSEEIAKPSVTDYNSAETTNEGYLLKEEAKKFDSRTRISEDNIREKTAFEGDQQRQSSDLENLTREPEDHEKKPFTWNLKSLANGFMRLWRGSD